MSKLTTSLPPGAYVGPQTTVLSLTPDIATADITMNVPGDVLYKVIAKYTGTPITVNLVTEGLNIVGALPTLMTNGDVPEVNTPTEVLLDFYLYQIQLNELLTVTTHNPDTGLDEVNGGVIYANAAGQPTCQIKLNVGSIPVVQGTITKNGKRVGEFSNQDTLTREHWYSNVVGSMPVRNGDLIEVQVNVPSYSIKSFIVKRDEIAAPKGISLSSIFKEANAMGFFGRKSYVNPANASKLLLDNINKDIPLTYKVKPNIGMPGYLKLLADFTNNGFQRDAINGDIYRTTAAALNAVANAIVGPGRPIIDASTNTVYAFLGGVIKAIPNLKAQDFYGAPRLVDSHAEPGPVVTYLVDVDNKIKPQ